MSSRLRFNATFLPIALLVLAAPLLLSAMPAEETWSVVPAPEWDSLFDRSAGWTGGDGIFSVPLSGNDAPGAASTTPTLFLFSDTFIGQVSPEGQRLAGSTLINNSLAGLEGGSPDPEMMRFFWRTNSRGDPTAIVVPSTPASQAGDWYWFGDGISLGARVHILASRMHRTGSGAWDFATAGVARVTLRVASDGSISDPLQVDLPLYVPASGTRGDVVFGSGILSNTAAAGAPSPDGYVYVYGSRNDPYIKKLVAARVRPEAFLDMAQWRFWDGTEWSTSIDRVAPLADRISPELSVTPIAPGKYALIHQLDTLGRDVVARVGPSPIGPWGPITTLWTCPEPDVIDPDVYCYNAKAHPHLSQPGELLVSYNVNTLDGTDHIRNADIYRPRFIRVRPAL